MKQENEEWRPIDGWPYEVSSLGRVRWGPSSAYAGRIVPPVEQYPRIVLRRGREIRQRSVHLLVAAAFLGKPSEGRTEVNHRNGNKQDPSAANLEWLTRRENQIHAYDSGLQRRGSGHGRAKLTDGQVRDIRQRYDGRYGQQTALAKEYGVSQALISKIARGEVWGHLDPGYTPKPCLAVGGRRGARHGQAKLTPRRVRAIRRACSAGASHEELAERFGVGRQIVRDIADGKTWKDVQ